MKKIVIFIFAFLISTQAKADLLYDLYVGVDAISASTLTISKADSGSTVQDKNKQNGSKTNFGANAGIRVDLLNLLAMGEVFYDNLQVSSQNFKNANGSQLAGSIDTKNRYGAKVSAGIALFPLVTTFVTFGLAKVNYTNKTDSKSVDGSKVAPLYGVGVIVDLPFTGLSAKASYDYQQISIQHTELATKGKTHLGVAKLGLLYSF